jgi:nitrate reductase molybdenum cofactor assembly chaperone NarJ/NarW
VKPHYDRLAQLFTYPDERYVDQCREAGLDDVAEKLAPLGVSGIQELFTATFDWNPSTSLDLSWHLYGEQYARGEFLVRVRQLLRDHGVRESAELPDHITHVLALLGRMEPQAAAAFTREYAATAVAKLVAALEQSESLFAPVMRAVREALPVRAPVPTLTTELPVLREETLR